LPGTMTLTGPNGGPGSVTFVIGPDGNVSYKSNLQGVLSGAGTNTLTVLGRTVTIDAVGGRFDLVVADLAFISLRTVAPVLAGELAAEGADLVWLVKPQFEVGRDVAARGRGVVRDPAAWRGALEGVGHALVGEGAAIMGAMSSPLRGADGNVEFLVWARAHSAGGRDVAAAVDDALHEAEQP